MTDRPRVWTLHAARDRLLGAPGDHQGVPPGSEVRVVEWDRERTVPVILAACFDAMASDDPEARMRDWAEAIFDALDPEGQPDD